VAAQAHDSNTADYTARAEPGTPLYRERVAQPIMAAVDALPPEFRELVYEFGYVDVYRAWKRGWTAAQIAQAAQAAGGLFELPATESPA